MPDQLAALALLIPALFAAHYFAEWRDDRFRVRRRPNPFKDL